MASIYDWSTTEANNATADPGINWQEGQPPSTVNNSARYMMRRAKELLNDIGAVATATGSANTISVTASSPFTAYSKGVRLLFKASATNTGATTLNVNAVGPKAVVRLDGGSETALSAGAIVVNGLLEVVYDPALASGVGAWVLINPRDSASYQVKTANYTALDADFNAAIRFTSAATLAFDVTANLRTNWRIEVWNDSTGLVTIDPDGTNTINGGLTLVLQPGQKAEVFKTSSTTFQAGIYGDPQVIPDYVRLLTIANNAGNPNTHIDIAAGSAKLGALIVANAATLTKRLNATWAAGSGNGGLDTGSPAINTFYHVYGLRKQSDGSFEAVLSLSAAGPTMTLLTGYDVIQRLGAIRTNGSGNISAFQQVGNIFRVAEVVDFTSGITVAQALMAVSVPTGVKVLAMFRFQATNSGGASDVSITLSPGDNPNLSTSQFYSGQTVGAVSGTKISVGAELTNVSAQVYRAAVVTGGGGQTAYIYTYGWQEMTIPRVI